MATVEMLSHVRPGLRWAPVEGSNALDFRKRKEVEIGSPDELDRVVMEAQTILGRCVPPNDLNGSDTGLVVGYVQSGKTLSFTAVMALARDNGYRLVVLIAGIGTNLKEQSERRLLTDLGLEDGKRAWVHFENPSPLGDDVTNIQNVLDAWGRSNVPPDRRRTILITVLKNHTRLKNLATVLGRLHLNGSPSLVIDDEADQASLNTKTASNKKTGKNQSSPTYDWITQIKSCLPHHTFLQYTATPQANLLIHLADALSPSFAEIVTPGVAYVGGREFFINEPGLVISIPAKDIPPTYSGSSPPDSLQSALRFYLLGAAVHYVTGQSGNRSMMIHPSQQTGPHSDYKSWVDTSVRSWRDLLEQPETSVGFEACAQLFNKEFQKLQSTYPSIPPLVELLRVMPLVIGETRIQQVNSRKEGEKNVSWRASDYWILIGGQKLDRGFTVEGLTVTYMPRSLGTGNADTVQQRARFFGYKRSYKGVCRIFLAQDAVSAFKHYVEHEEFVRGALIEFQGRPLMEWKRDFILTRLLKPTRTSVVGLDADRVLLTRGWNFPIRLHKDSTAYLGNQKILRDLVGRLEANYQVIDAADHEKFKDLRSNSPRNKLIEAVPVGEIVNTFLSELRIPDYDDSSLHTALIMALNASTAANANELCDVFLIGELLPQTRSITSTGRINQLFVGKSPNTDDFDKLTYVGDSALYGGDRLTVHLRAYDLRDSNGTVLAKSVPWYALHLPERMIRDAVIESGSRS